MNGVDSPLEVLSLSVNVVNNLTPLFNNLWAFLAVFTAAMFSFRHFRRASVVKTLHETVLHKVNDNVITNAQVKQDDDKEVEVREEEQEVVVLSRGNSKNFFTVFYEGEGENNKEGCVYDDVDGVDEEEEGENEVIIEKWTVEMRGGELGWYEFQDRSVINGSVVKLWEGEKEKSNSPRRRGNNKSCSFGVITPFGLLA